MNEQLPENAEAAQPAGEPAPVSAPKKRRTAASKAAAVAAPVDAEASAAAEVAVTDETAAAPKKRRSPRKTAVSTETVAETAATEVAVAAVAAPQEPVAEVVASEAPASKPARAPRTRKKTAEVSEAAVPAVAAPVAEPVAAPVEASSAAPEVVAVEMAASAAETEQVEQAADSAEAGADNVDDGGRRKRDRTRRRDRRGRDENDRPAKVAGAAEGEGSAAAEEVVEIVVAAGDDDELPDTEALFAEVMSGEYDTETAVTSEEEIVAEQGKRVLRPEPDAPKLHKVLAQAGIGSRREMEQLIEDGQVSVNGEPAHIGMRIAQGDQIRLAGRPIKVRIAPPPARVLAYHKQVGEVVTHHDPEGRPTVFRRLPRLHSGKWLSVGRLDINTEGLLLFTNSGDLANQLMHPRFGVEREYAARVLGSLSQEQKARLLEGVEIEGQKAAFKSIEDGGGEGVNRWYRVVITEGRNREVRKLFDAVGLTVSRLIRIRYGTVVLPRGLKRGVWVELDDHDVRSIKALAGPEQGARPALGDGAGGPGQGQGRGKKGRGPRAERGGERGDRDGAPRHKGAQHGGDRAERFDRPDRPERQERFERPDRVEDRAERGDRGDRPEGRFDRPPRGDRQEPRQDRPDRQGGRGGHGQNAQNAQKPRNNAGRGGPRGQSSSSQGQGEDPMYIPNPLEQTFDKRFVSGSKRITTGFGRPSDEHAGGDSAQRNKGGPRQPDPMQTSVGYIGAEAYFTRPGGQGKGRGGRRR